MTPLNSALTKLERITADGVALTPAEAVAVREALGGRQVVREMVAERSKRPGLRAVQVWPETAGKGKE